LLMAPPTMDLAMLSTVSTISLWPVQIPSQELLDVCVSTSDLDHGGGLHPASHLPLKMIRFGSISPMDERERLQGYKDI
jgi:hypothetical protein